MSKATPIAAEASTNAASTAGLVAGLFTPEFVANPYQTYAFLHAMNPFFQLPGTNTWLAVRYADCHAILRDKRFGHDFDGQLLKGDGAAAFNEPSIASLRQMLLVKDPPDHKRLRGLVVRAFDGRSIARMQTRIRTLVDQLIDRMLPLSGAGGGGDLMALFAHPFPVLVICELLGIPEEDRARFLDSYEVGGRIIDPTPMTPAELAAANASTLNSNAYFEALCDERRKRPKDDLITYLVQSETDEGRLTSEELTANISLLFAAGHETTKNLIGNGLLALYRNPDQLALLRAQPELTANAIEELLRYDSSVQLTARTTLEDAELNGVALPKGTEVITLIGAANHDPAQFADPGRLDITRNDVTPLSFGGGIHFCLGAQLARLEAAEAFPALLARLPRLQLQNLDAPEWRTTITLRGLKTLLATW